MDAPIDPTAMMTGGPTAVAGIIAAGRMAAGRMAAVGETTTEPSPPGGAASAAPPDH